MCAKCKAYIGRIPMAKTIKYAGGWEVAVWFGNTIRHLDKRFVLRYALEREYTETIFRTRAEARRYAHVYNEVQRLQNEPCQIQLKRGLR